MKLKSQIPVDWEQALTTSSVSFAAGTNHPAILKDQVVSNTVGGEVPENDCIVHTNCRLLDCTVLCTLWQFGIGYFIQVQPQVQ